MQAPKLLANVLKKGANNFDILRLVAALAVIVGHGYAISPQPPLQDGVLSLLHFDYSGSLAVKFFFFLSGLLVTNSILQKPDAFHFLVKRICRIFPGLLVCLLVSVFIVGPLFTKLPLAEYFSNSETWKYIVKNFFLFNMLWRLPGVFTESAYGLNGSLWTLPFEMICYIYLAVFFGLGLLKNKIVANIFFTSVIAVSFIGPQYLPDMFAQHPEAHLLPACFAIGALFANNKGWININISRVILFWLLVILVKDSVVYQFVFYIAFFYTVIFISSLDFAIHRLKLPFDASYGVYVYGFMIQQCVHASFPGIGVHGNQLLSSVIAVFLGILSWYFIEKPFIAFGNKVVNPDYQLMLKNRIMDSRKAGLSPWRNMSGATGNNIFVFFFLSILAFIVHAIVLKFIFPGYYSPLYPQHSDFYIPAAFANSAQDSFRSLLSWPRPVNMIFAKLIGYSGIHGSIACVIAIVCMSCALTALLVIRVLKLKFNWQLMLVFAAYCYLLFSEPYFYIFYAQDIGAHVSYFLLILGAYLFYSTFKRNIILTNAILFFCSLLAFLSKETYGLAALIIALLWFVYYRKTSFLRATLPGIMIGLAFVLAFVNNMLIKSVFVNPNATAADPYHISLNPRLVLREFFLYAKEAMNVANVILILLLGYVFLKSRNEKKNILIYISIGCLAGALVSWVPNAILPNHHYKGYSFNGAYLLYVPLLFFPILWVGKNVTNGIVIAVLILCFGSPLLNINKYKDNDWVLIQEETQRNLLGALDPLIKNINPSQAPQKILIEGITFPFHPFAFPKSLRTFPNAKYATFDIVRYGVPTAGAERIDLVKFINPSDTTAADYQQKWIFDKDGKLVSTVNLVAEKIFNNHRADTNETVQVRQDNFSLFTTNGFYNAENGIRWTNGKASINLNAVVSGRDSLVVQLNTYMPPVCKAIVPRIVLIDTNNREHISAFSTRKGDIFYYLFVLNKKSDIKKVDILSETVDASPDQRILSFPFMSLEIRKNIF
ncbi:MAG TPA: acyltransferase [Puia sp.]|nr:acyltransferase [Puia sp.]